MAVADRPFPSTTAISPKISPFFRVIIVRVVFLAGPFADFHGTFEDDVHVAAVFAFPEDNLMIAQRLHVSAVSRLIYLHEPQFNTSQPDLKDAVFDYDGTHVRSERHYSKNRQPRCESRRRTA
jgi:hypothetical protein